MRATSTVSGQGTSGQENEGTYHATPLIPELDSRAVRGLPNRATVEFGNLSAGGAQGIAKRPWLRA